MEKQANSHDRKAMFLNSEIKSILDEKRLLSEGIRRDHAEIFFKFDDLRNCAIQAYSDLSNSRKELSDSKDEQFLIVIKCIMMILRRAILHMDGFVECSKNGIPLSAFGLFRQQLETKILLKAILMERKGANPRECNKSHAIDGCMSYLLGSIKNEIFKYEKLLKNASIFHEEAENALPKLKSKLDSGFLKTMRKDYENCNDWRKILLHKKGYIQDIRQNIKTQGFLKELGISDDVYGFYRLISYHTHSEVFLEMDPMANLDEGIYECTPDLGGIMKSMFALTFSILSTIVEVFQLQNMAEPMKNLDSF